MKKIFLLFIAVVCLGSCQIDIKSDNPDPKETETITEEEALNLLHRWTKAYLEGDASELNEILDDTWLYSGSSDGKTTDKDATIAEFSSADYIFGDITYENLEVELYGDIAVVRGSEDMVIIGKSQPDTTRLSLRFTDVYQKKNGKIRAISTHSSPIDTP